MASHLVCLWTVMQPIKQPLDKMPPKQSFWYLWPQRLQQCPRAKGSWQISWFVKKVLCPDLLHSFCFGLPIQKQWTGKLEWSTFVRPQQSSFLINTHLPQTPAFSPARRTRLEYDRLSSLSRDLFLAGGDFIKNKNTSELKNSGV